MHKKTVIDFRELNARYIFTEPLFEIKTRQLEQVPELIKQVESYQKAGYYVVGYVSYEASPAFEPKMKVHSTPLLSEYLLYFTVHDKAEKTSIPITYQEVELASNWEELTNESEYEQAIAQIHHHLRQGDTYQVNYTVQLQQELSVDAFQLYNRLVVEQEAGYNAFIEHDEMAVLSISPELFFEQDGRDLMTRPMKGTTKRGLCYQDDLKQASWLEQDDKNRSENMMIVDLLRNDMNRLSEVGSERVEQLCHVEQYSTVWQMTSTIKSLLRSDVDLLAIFEALFPCGSITGAPKIATMDIIHRLEPQARGVYCGSIGLLLPEGRRLFNVAIRTLQLSQNRAIYGVGGGITWDSAWQAEYQEVQQKSAILYRKAPQFDLLTTGKITQQQLVFQEEHLERLTKASRYFAYPFDKEEARKELENVLPSCQKEVDYRCQIRVNKAGDLAIQMEPLTPLSQEFCQAELCLQEEDLQQAFTFFKTSHRPHLQVSEREKIYYNQQGELLETSIGNLIVEIDGQSYTPPVQMGILPGIYRQFLLDSGHVLEKKLTVEELQLADAVYGCNAVRGLYPLKVR